MTRPPTLRGLTTAVALTLGFLLAACAAPPATAPGTASPTGPGAALRVVTSTTILADFVRQVGGDLVEVHAVIPAGRDVHTFEPAPSDAVRLAGADLLVMNGVGLDEWFESLAEEAARGVPLLVVGEDLDGAEYFEDDEGEHEEDHEEDHEEGTDENDDHDHAVNPHLWLDVGNARLYAARLASELAAIDPERESAYSARADDFDARLAELDAWIGAQVGGLPEEKRRVVSFHDAFPYFAHAYGIEIVGVVVDSPGQEPSAGEVARLIGAIREAGVRAILTEVQFDDRLAQTIAGEAGVSVIDDLYTDSLGDPPLDTYEAVMRWNTERIVDGLR